jgi:rod shape-determining protein MreD
MTRYALYTLLGALAIVLQTTWLGSVSLGGIVADPLLAIVLAVGLLHGPEEGALVGAGLGLLQDVMTGVPLGLGMLGNLIVGFCAGLGQRSIYVEDLSMPALAGAVMTVLRAIVWIGAAHLVGLLDVSFLEAVWVTVLAACYNGLIAVPVFHGLRRLDRALVRLYERSRQL